MGVNLLSEFQTTGSIKNVNGSQTQNNPSAVTKKEESRQKNYS